MCGVSPAASFYFVFVSSELPALCGTKVVQYNNVLYKFLSLPRQKIQIPHSLETLTCQIPHSHGTNLWSNAYVCLGNLKFAKSSKVFIFQKFAVKVYFGY